MDGLKVVEPRMVLTFWLGGDQRENYRTKWFVSNPEEQRKVDFEIYEQFNDTFEAAIRGDLHRWKSETQSTIALIILLDQFSRHIFRYRELPLDDEMRGSVDGLALQCAMELTTKVDWQDRLSTAEKVFVLMPFRHNASMPHLNFVVESIDSVESCLDWEKELMTRFRKQTVRRLQELSDKVAARNADNILEREAFDADESDMIDNPLTVAVRDFLAAHRPVKNMKHPVAISLSGGVDSMVICKILAKLAESESWGESVVAIHIDYANREESAQEADYVEGYCRSLKNVLFRKRVVDEVTRGVTDRAKYEMVSREARYGFYRQVLRETGCEGVIFGHHQGDVQENVISNVMRGCSPLALSGMESVGMTNQVPVWRPLLSFHKNKIYDFAHKYGVPYFRDTTPTWSTRGKLRNHLLPLLTDMYGQGCLTNLTALAHASDQNRDLVAKNLYGPFLQSVQRGSCGLSVNITERRSQPLTFWREALKELMHSLSLPLVREKAVVTFMDRIDEMKGPFGWLELRKGFSIHLDEEGTLTVLRPEASVKEADLRDEAGEYLKIALSTLEVGQSKSLVIGDWTITVTMADIDEGGEERILQYPAALIFGSFIYSVPISEGCSYLELLQALGGGRKKVGQRPPPQLTGIDPKLRGQLPLFTALHAKDADKTITGKAVLEYTFGCEQCCS